MSFAASEVIARPCWRLITSTYVVATAIDSGGESTNIVAMSSAHSPEARAPQEAAELANSAASHAAVDVQPKPNAARSALWTGRTGAEAAGGETTAVDETDAEADAGVTRGKAKVGTAETFFLRTEKHWSGLHPRSVTRFPCPLQRAGEPPWLSILLEP